MTPTDIDRVFGRGRLRMVTGDHVEVFREASLPGERRRYTKRFLATSAGDFREWTEREWRILARLVGHGVRAVPEVVQFDRGAADRPALVQTYDAGVTVDHWATLLPLERDGAQLRNVFEDCAHWWALARHCLAALDAIHALQLVHLDLKADNVCIPIGPAGFDPHAADATLHARFDELALIDFAFSLVSGEPLQSALPIAHQSDYEYQSPRLLRALDAGRFGNLAPTRELDWRADLFSLAAMLWRYLPEIEGGTPAGWSAKRHAKARALVRRLVEAHDAEPTGVRPHAEFIASASDMLDQAELRESLQRGWQLAARSDARGWISSTPVTRIALPVAASTGEEVARAVPTSTLPTADAVAAETSAAPTVTPITMPIAAAQIVAAPSADEANAIGAPAQIAAAPSPDRANGGGAAPWFFGAGEAEPFAVDPTDVDARAALHQARRRQGSRRGRAWAGGVAIAAAAAASVPLLAPGWLNLPVLQRPDRQVALAPATPTPAPRAAALPLRSPLAVPPSRAAQPAAHVVAAPAASAVSAAMTTPTPIAPATPTGAPSPIAAPTSTSAAVPMQLRSTTASTTAKQPVHVASHTAPTARLAAAAPPRRSAQRTAAVRATPTSATHPQAPNRSVAPAPARPQLQLALAPAAAPRPPALARTWQDRAAPIPWAVAGRPAPRLTSAPRTMTFARAPAPFDPAARTASPTVAPRPAIATPPGEPIRVAAADQEARPVPSTARAVAPAPGSSATAASTPAPVPALKIADAAPDFVARANELMTHQVPRLAQHAERSVARVLFAAGRSEHVRDDETIRASAVAISRGPVDPLAGMTLRPQDAERLNDAARAEYARRGGTPEALMLQVRAFGADPLDAEIAGNLAFLLLRQRPAQPEAARQLALHALTLRGARNPEGRIEDWATLAIASALSGRERDARNAFLVTLALAPNLERQCKAALDVVALYGERLRAPVEAMLQSAQASARGQQSALCESPPHWVASSGAAAPR